MEDQKTKILMWEWYALVSILLVFAVSLVRCGGIYLSEIIGVFLFAAPSLVVMVVARLYLQVSFFVGLLALFVMVFSTVGFSCRPAGGGASFLGVVILFYGLLFVSGFISIFLLIRWCMRKLP